jgi:hypothetical protein
MVPIDVLVDLADVPLPGGGLQLDDVQVPVEELVHRRLGAGVAVLVDLGEQPGPGALGLTPRGDGFLEVALLAGVHPGVHTGAERAARQLLDPSALPPLGGDSPRGHGAPYRGVDPTRDPTRNGEGPGPRL